MPTLSLTIGGVERSGLLRKSTLQVPDALGQRGTCRFVLDDTSGAGYHPEEGQEVVVTYDGVPVFGGTIDRCKWRVENGTTMTVSELACVDYNQIPDRHLVAATYEDMSAGDIVRDLVSTYLADEGIDVLGPVLAATGSEVGPTSYVGSAVVGSYSFGGVADGPTIEKVVFTYMTVTACLNELAQLVGFYWNIGPDKLLTFAPAEQVRAPFDISEAATTDPVSGDAVSNFRSMSVERTRDQYRNRQYLRAGTDVTDARAEVSTGDGTRMVFGTAFPIAYEPTIEVKIGAGAYTTKTVGIKGVDAMGTHDWYWNKGESEVVQDDAGTPLTSSDRVRVTYQGTFPIVIASSSQDEVEARAALEGGSGVYEAVEDDQSIDSVALAQTKAQALLRRYGSIPEQVEFETDEPGLQAGQLVYVWSPQHGVDGDYLIESADTRDIGVGEQFLRTTIRATSGERLDNWVDFFRKVIDSGRRFVLRENEKLALGRSVAEVLTMSDVLTLEQADGDAAVGIVGEAIVSFSEVGSTGVTITGSEVGTGEVGAAVTGRG